VENKRQLVLETDGRTVNIAKQELTLLEMRTVGQLLASWAEREILAPPAPPAEEPPAPPKLAEPDPPEEPATPA